MKDKHIWSSHPAPPSNPQVIGGLDLSKAFKERDKALGIMEEESDEDTGDEMDAEFTPSEDELLAVLPCTNSGEEIRRWIKRERERNVLQKKRFKNIQIQRKAEEIIEQTSQMEHFKLEQLLRKAFAKQNQELNKTLKQLEHLSQENDFLRIQLANTSQVSSPHPGVVLTSAASSQNISEAFQSVLLVEANEQCRILREEILRLQSAMAVSRETVFEDILRNLVSPRTPLRTPQASGTHTTPDLESSLEKETVQTGMVKDKPVGEKSQLRSKIAAVQSFKEESQVEESTRNPCFVDNTLETKWNAENSMYLSDQDHQALQTSAFASSTETKGGEEGTKNRKQNAAVYDSTKTHPPRERISQDLSSCSSLSCMSTASVDNLSRWGTMPSDTHDDGILSYLTEEDIGDVLHITENMRARVGTIISKIKVCL